ncbi:hypothetical protein EVAR_39990_1 [Eumeta japonica]|uniref:SAP domain-containing protein n=1 Tax=Eumeta variegata TaxID=151549 RepID=A0A4C1YEP4_EUMVA|nr:hypothetical protein EVAR_39990_1 [Eumeta japonica]
MAGTRRLRTQSGSSGVVRQVPSNETRGRHVLTPEALAAMNKEQLRAECRRRGQRSTGNKAELVPRCFWSFLMFCWLAVL